MKNYWQEQRFESIVWLIYSSFSFIWLWLHEPWRDEGQAWLIVRDLNLLDVFKQMAWEGSPALWHVLLFPFAKLGFPYYSMLVLHWLIAISAAWLLLFKSPFSTLLKTVFIFSYLMLYEYVIIARNYNLSILILFAIASLYKSRFEKPILYSFLIFLLFNTNIHSFAAAVVLIFIYFWELVSSKDFQKNKVIALFIMLLGGLLVFLQMPLDSSLQHHAVISVSSYNFDAAFVAIGNSFLAGFGLNIFAGIILSLILLMFFVRYLEKPVILFFLIVSISWLLYIFGSIHTGDLRHHGLIMIFLIFSLWLEKLIIPNQQKFSRIKINLDLIRKITNYILVLCLLVSVFMSFKFYRNDLLFSYSGSKETARFIKENISPNQIIIAHQSFACSSLLPFLPNYRFWYADIQEMGSFITWDEEFAENAYTLTNDELLKRASLAFDNQGKIYLLNSPFIGNSDNLELIFQNMKQVFSRKDEIFYIYKEK
ncbi:hypothetical protein ACFLYJ_00695 [Candidatus Cloacimonadota bacterium]